MRSLCLAAFPVVIWLTGCNRGPAKPDDLPALTPCKLTVTYQSSPLSDATVTLTAEGEKWVGVGHPGGCNVLLADASVHFVSETIDAGSISSTIPSKTSGGKSPFGIWGALGTKAKSESASLP